MSSPVDDLKGAGFSDDEIGAWSADQRATLGAAGFDDNEIDTYLGGKRQVPQAFLDRLSAGTSVGRVLGQIGKGVAEGYGDPQPMSPGTESFWRDVGIFNDPEKGQAGPIRMFNEAVMRPIAAGINVTAAAINAGVTGLGRGIGQTAKEVGAPGADRLGDEAINFMNFLMADAGGRGAQPLMRIERGPTGAMQDAPLGGLPEPGDFGDAAHVTLNAASPPSAVSKVTRLWDDHGIHPAEVAHDAITDVTISQDLAADGDGLPQAYVRAAERAAPEPTAPAAVASAPERAAPEAQAPSPSSQARDRRIEQLAKRQAELEGKERDAVEDRVLSDVRVERARLEMQRDPLPDGWTIEPDHEGPAGYVAVDGQGNIIARGDNFVDTLHLARAEVPETSPRPPARPSSSEPLPNIPAAAPGFVRFFHGGPPAQEGVTVDALPTSGGGRWTSPHYIYARDYRRSQQKPGAVWYVDLPVDSADARSAETVSDADVKFGIPQRYASIEVSEESAKGFKPYNSEAVEAEKLARTPLRVPGASELALAPTEIAADVSQKLQAAGRPAEEAQAAEAPPTEGVESQAAPTDTSGQVEAAPAQAGVPDAATPAPEAEAPSESGLSMRLLSDESGSVPLGRDEPPRSPAERSILDRLSVGETDAGRKWTWDRFYTAMVDRLHPIETAVRDAAVGADLKAADDPYKIARLYAGVSGKADQWLTHGTFDFNDYAPTGKPLKEILAPVSDDLDGFRAYATSLRALELEGQGIRTGMDLTAAREVAVAGDAEYAPVMAELVQYQNKLAAYLRDSGVVSEEGYAAMTRQHQLYIPFQRVFGDVVGDVVPDVIRGQGRTLQASNPIHGIVGSERRVIDPLESIIRNTYLSIMMAERNAVGTKLVDLLDRASGLPEPAATDAISIMRNGTKETHEVSADLAAAIKGLDEESANTMLRLMGLPARMLRAGATLSPDFLLRNPIRDFFSAVINTTKGVFSPIDTAKGFMSVVSKDANFEEWLKGGGANSALVSLDRRYLQQNLEKLTADTGLMSRSWNVVRHPIDTLRILSEITEQSTRLGEFMAARDQAIRQGMTPKEAAQEAAYTSREVTLDFARRGAMTQSMNMITAFWNAQVQGVDRLGRAFRDDPVGTSLKIAGGITLPSMLLWWANHDDPRWKEIPAWERDLFWLVMTKDHIFRIPKPFEVGVMFGSGPERVLDAYFDQKPEAFHDFSNSVMSALLPGAIPTMALPVVEQWANRSSFIDRPLVPQSLEKLLPEYQYAPYTTETAKALGGIIGAFPGVRDVKLDNGPASGVARALSTPILLENYVRAWTGGLGNYALQAADAGLRKSGILPDPPKPEDTLADIPVVRAFVVRYPSAGAESIQRFYDEYEKNKRYFDTFLAKAKEGDIAATKHVEEMGGTRIFTQLDGFKEALGEHSQLVRDIWKDPEMSPHEKRQLIDQLYMSMTEIAQGGMSVIRQMNVAQ